MQVSYPITEAQLTSAFEHAVLGAESDGYVFLPRFNSPPRIRAYNPARCPGDC
jgi:hypothetical protein